MAITLVVAGTLAVAAVALVGLAHRAPVPVSAQRGDGSTLAALEAKLAVLRRPQTAADRSDLGIATDGVIVKLIRLVATVDIAGAAPVRVYVLVHRLPRYPLVGAPGKPGSYFARAIAVDRRGETQGVTDEVSGASLSPSAVGGGPVLPIFGGYPKHGVSLAIVTDGVTRVKWTFTGAWFGVLHPRPVTVYPDVRNNVAVAPISPGEGPLARAVWYGAGGHVISSATGGVPSRTELHRIKSVNASRGRPIAPVLIAHYALFRTVAPDDLAHDAALPTPGTEGGYVGEFGLNYWQTRYIPSVTGLDGPGLWITPGARGLCMSDPQASGCGRLASALFIGGTTSNGSEETISGLVPDGNPTVTVVLASGARKTVPVVDNVYEATFRGRVIAIISRDVAGRVERRSLG